LTIPRAFMRSGSMTVVGVGVLKSLVRLMREPVTVTSSSAAAPLPAASPAGAFCACAAVATHNARAKPHGRLKLQAFELMAVRTVAAMAERIEIIWAPSQQKTNVDLRRVHLNQTTRR